MKKDNKGFSLVELIIVIAIMAVLIGVLAPTFIKYVEQSRRSTDIQNAEQIKTAIEADMADGRITEKYTGATLVAGGDGVDLPEDNKNINASTIKEVPTVRSSISGVKVFTVDCNPADGTCTVYLSTYKLTEPSGAQSYKDAK